MLDRSEFRPLPSQGNRSFLGWSLITGGVVCDAGLDVALFARLSAPEGTVLHSRLRFVRAAHSAYRLSIQLDAAVCARNRRLSLHVFVALERGRP